MRWRAGREDRWAGRLVDEVPIHTGGGRVGVRWSVYFANIFEYFLFSAVLTAS